MCGRFIEQKMKQPSGDKFEFKDHESNVSPGGFHNTVQQIWNFLSVFFYMLPGKIQSDALDDFILY